MTISREIKTATLVILGLILIVFTFNYLKGENLLDGSRKFHANFDNVNGLATSAPVTINGLTVGKVQSITFNDDGKGSLNVTLLVENNFQFSENSTIEIYEPGLIGGKAIAIKPAFDGAANAKNGATLTSSIKLGMMETLDVSALQDKIAGVMVSADSLLTNINQIFDTKTKANLQLAIGELNTTISLFKNTSISLNELISSNQEKLNNALSNVEGISEDLSKVTDDLSKKDISTVITSLEATLANANNLLNGIQQGKGTLGKLATDEQLYNNLVSATNELEELLRDFKLHPKRYTRILSKKEIPYQENKDN